jgi:hypothetical protein
LEQFIQWVMVVMLPLATLVFAFAGVQAFRTHGCSFDSIVLFLCGAFNLVYLMTDLL